MNFQETNKCRRIITISTNLRRRGSKMLKKDKNTINEKIKKTLD